MVTIIRILHICLLYAGILLRLLEEIRKSKLLYILHGYVQLKEKSYRYHVVTPSDN